jgi:transcriptional regulator with XRE-family HTH domain
MIDNLGSGRTQVAVEEGFVVEVQSFLQELMSARGMTRAELARAMGVSRARVTQIFSDECTNLTIRLLARAVHALGEVPNVDSELTRRRRTDRERENKADLIRGASNVVPLWQDASDGNSADQECVGDDARLNGIVGLLRRAGGRG